MNTFEGVNDCMNQDECFKEARLTRQRAFETMDLKGVNLIPANKYIQISRDVQAILTGRCNVRDCYNKPLPIKE